MPQRWTIPLLALTLLAHPTTLTHDGAFHPIILETPDRVVALTIRSGYYAPKPPKH